MWSLPLRVFTRSELLGYVSYGGDLVHSALAGLTDERAAQPLPDEHRRAGTPYAVLLGSIPLHVTEHASQIRQHVRDSGFTTRPLVGDRHFRP